MGNMMSGGEEQAYDDLQSALEQAEDMEKRGLKGGVALLTPEMKMGTSALHRVLQSLTGTTPIAAIDKAEASFAQTPSQQFEMQQALDAVNNAMAASGITGSGAQQQALTQTVGDILGKQQQEYLRNLGGVAKTQLNDLLGIGQIGAGATGEAAQGVFGGTRTLADIISQIGAAEAGEDVARGGMQSGLIGTLLSGLGTGLRAGFGARPGGFSMPAATGGFIGGII